MSVIPLTPWLYHRPRRGATVVDTAVLHASAHESVDDLVRELRADDHSYHYILDRNGTIFKGVPFSAAACHCGNSYGPHEAARGVSTTLDGIGQFVEHTCVIEYSLGICLMNKNDGAEPYPRAQIETLSTLLKDLKTPLPKLRYLTSHALISPGRFYDPRGLALEPIAKTCGLEIWSSDLAAV